MPCDLGIHVSEAKTRFTSMSVGLGVGRNVWLDHFTALLLQPQTTRDHCGLAVLTPQFSGPKNFFVVEVENRNAVSVKQSFERDAYTSRLAKQSNRRKIHAEKRSPCELWP